MKKLLFIRKKFNYLFVVSFLSIFASPMLYAGTSSNYTTGPYFNLGLGAAIFTIPNFLSQGNDLTAGSVAVRAGLGFIGDITHDNLPVFAGLEANGNYYNLTSNSDVASLYGADLAAIIGKQITTPVAIYAKLGGNVIGKQGGYLFGPQVGAGLGYQLTSNVRLTGEADYSLEIAGVEITTFLAGLQYSF